MSSPLHAAWYADTAVQKQVEIVENVRLAKDTYRLRFQAPEIAKRVVPGQFLMLRLAGLSDPLIGRPLALYDTALSPAGGFHSVDVVYVVKGKLTSHLQHIRPGERLDVWGPLGNGFQNSPLTTHHSPLTPHLILVAGGIGFTPFLAVAKEALGAKNYGDETRVPARTARVTFCYGARTADYFAGVEEFEKLGVDIRLATDDGSRGRRGLVTELLNDVLAESTEGARIACCGPEPMMEAVAKIAVQRNVPCELSLETPMACGIGICFTCVAKIRQPDGGWDYKRTCVEGPVFDSALIEW